MIYNPMVTFEVIRTTAKGVIVKAIEFDGLRENLQKAFVFRIPSL
jgi:hypothetical protein